MRRKTGARTIVPTPIRHEAADRRVSSSRSPHPQGGECLPLWVAVHPSSDPSVETLRAKYQTASQLRCLLRPLQFLRLRMANSSKAKLQFAREQKLQGQDLYFQIHR